MVVYGDVNVVVHGNMNERICGNKKTVVDGDYTINTRGTYRNVVLEGAHFTQVNGDIGFKTNANFTTNCQMNHIQRIGVAAGNLDTTIVNGGQKHVVGGDVKNQIQGACVFDVSRNFNLNSTSTFAITSRLNMNINANFGIKIKSHIFPITIISNSVIRSYSSLWTHYGNMIVAPAVGAPDLIAQGNIYNIGTGFFSCISSFHLTSIITPGKLTAAVGSIPILTSLTIRAAYTRSIILKGICLSPTCW